MSVSLGFNTNRPCGWCMGIVESLMGGEEEFDHYRVCRSSAGSSQGAWVPVEGWTELDNPPEKDEFELNTGQLEPGRYKPYGVISGMNRQLPTELRWTVEVEPDGEEEEGEEEQNRAAQPESAGLKNEIHSLKSEIREIKDEGHAAGHGPEEIMEDIRARLMMSAVSNEQFMQRHGDQVFDWVFEGAPGGDDDDGPGYEEWKDNPYAAIAFDMTQTAMKEPHKLNELGQNLGGGAGAFLDGFAEGAQEGPPTAEPDAEDGEEPTTGLEDLDAGPASLDELAGSDDEADDVAGEISDLLKQRREAEESDESAPRAEDDAQATIEESAAQSDTAAADAAENEPPEGMDEAATSPMRASPEAADTMTGPEGNDLDPNRCQFVKDDGEQCGNPKEEGSNYCWVEDHQPDEPDESAADSSGPDEPDESAPPTGDGTPSEEEVANVI